ncbi:DUF3094 domain-containing protein [Gilvimarinus agarilyticus]|uniref:DUF3094 family protein n=1 Tax=unclassified Gilvimarinus TaxID=2642066 RepID=UPI001C09E497|nr:MULTISPECIES: DUF3094 family protein [unclassified Gilvimarinus]MBU2885341.1 DUF3094 domain-containing protein [Gilvimarinus agarilyticus]MDO6570240.1 DUF3094 family protein [Gilvimarinus sp. 2_MG-2023]MDO6748235.1 DUF3094 family protein [Gilvimarinus sp. 1_MG-2023]
MASKLSAEDQARVDSVLHRGVNSTERKPFKVWTLFAFLLMVLTVMSLFSFYIAWRHGVV